MKLRRPWSGAIFAWIAIACASSSLAAGTAAAQSPGCESRLQFLAPYCWCPDDYQPKPIVATCRLLSCLPDCYDAKPLPPRPCRVGCCGPDLYAPKDLPVRPCSAERSFLCIPHWPDYLMR